MVDLEGSAAKETSVGWIIDDGQLDILWIPQTLHVDDAQISEMTAWLPSLAVR